MDEGEFEFTAGAHCRALQQSAKLHALNLDGGVEAQGYLPLIGGVIESATDDTPGEGHGSIAGDLVPDDELHFSSERNFASGRQQAASPG